MEEKQDLQKITVLKNKQEIFFDKIKKLKNNIKITDKGIKELNKFIEEWIILKEEIDSFIKELNNND